MNANPRLICWPNTAQINLGFAFTLKQRFVEKFGEIIEANEDQFYLFPSFITVAFLSPDELLALQFSRQKAAYTIGIAKAFVEGKISKEKLKGLSLNDAKEELIKIKGIGNWTANYALMKTFRYPDAFPLEDAGLHNAIKNQLQLKSKPKPERVKRIFKKYKGWEAYATLYLWKSLWKLRCEGMWYRLWVKCFSLQSKQLDVGFWIEWKGEYSGVII